MRWAGEVPSAAWEPFLLAHLTTAGKMALNIPLSGRHRTHFTAIAQESSKNWPMSVPFVSCFSQRGGPTPSHAGIVLNASVSATTL